MYSSDGGRQVFLFQPFEIVPSETNLFGDKPLIAGIIGLDLVEAGCDNLRNNT